MGVLHLLADFPGFFWLIFLAFPNVWLEVIQNDPLHYEKQRAPKSLEGRVRPRSNRDGCVRRVGTTIRRVGTSVLRRP